METRGRPGPQPLAPPRRGQKSRSQKTEWAYWGRNQVEDVVSPSGHAPTDGDVNGGHPIHLPLSQFFEEDLAPTYQVVDRLVA